MDLVDGDPRDGTYERTITIPPGAADGEWEVTIYPLSDTLGNSSGLRDFEFFGTLGIVTTYYDTVVTPAPVVFTDEDGTADDTYTIPDVDGVQYLVGDDAVEAGTHPGSGTVTVTAEALEDYAFSEDADTEWSHTFSSVTTVTPEPVVFTDEDGTANDTYTVPDVEGVQYRVGDEAVENGTFPGSGEVVVKAEPLEDYVFPEDAVVEWAHSFSAVATVVPEAPLFVDRPGTEDDAITIPEVTGVQYAVDGEQVEPGTESASGEVAVTAEPVDDTYVFPEGATTSWTFTFTERTPVNPEPVTFTDEDGAASDSFTIPDVEGVEYLVDEEVVESGTHAAEGAVTVKAQALDGYVLAEAAVSEWTHTFDARTTVTPQPVTFTDEHGTENDTYTVPESEGVQYLVSGEIVEAGTHPGSGEVTVIAEALENYVIADGADVEWTHVFSDISPRMNYQFFLANGWTGAPDYVFTYGRTTDEVLIGDWNGDGRDTIAIRRGNEFHVSNSPRGGEADVVFRYGRPDDVVLVGDWDGDGVDTLAVRRGNAYHVKNSLRPGEADTVIRYGRADDDVMVGDWDGNGTDTLAVRRGAEYHVKNSMAAGAADRVFTYGRPDDVTLAGDWDGNGTDTFAVRRGSVYHVKNSLAGGPADFSQAYGRAGDAVYVGDWNGDGRDSLGVSRTS